MALGKIEMGEEGAIVELLVSVIYICMHVYIYVRMHIGVPHRESRSLRCRCGASLGPCQYQRRERDRGFACFCKLAYVCIYKCILTMYEYM